MPKKLVFIPAIFFIVLCFFACQQQIDANAEKEAIKTVLRAQLDAMKNFSVDGEVAVWANKPYVVRYNLVGWDSVLAHYQKRMPQLEKRYEMHEFTLGNCEIHLNGNFAAVFHEEEAKGVDRQSNADSVYTHQGKALKYLEKINGEWKIIGQFNPH